MSIKEKIGYGFIILVIFSVAFFFFTPAQFLRGRGTSMEPVLHDGDGIVIVPPSWVEVDEGEIIAFYHGGSIVVHQVIGFEDERIITRGVNRPEDDVERVEPSDVIGVHVLTIPKAGILLQHVDSSAGFVLLVVVPTALIVFNESRKIHRELRKGDN